MAGRKGIRQARVRSLWRTLERCLGVRCRCEPCERSERGARGTGREGLGGRHWAGPPLSAPARARRDRLTPVRSVLPSSTHAHVARCCFW
ncbi:unnamed protein product [Pieris macdunnoughi]|uniref:Uncharacterized protein n=1 Tax=Pieris macdunnoughi TaxID=345717 RepID=A0A821LPI9_9NEOP|nr:unnamed protein product [Pieris macdunnoughi]